MGRSGLGDLLGGLGSFPYNYPTTLINGKICYIVTGVLWEVIPPTQFIPYLPTLQQYFPTYFPTFSTLFPPINPLFPLLFQLFHHFAPLLSSASLRPHHIYRGLLRVYAPMIWHLSHSMISRSQ